MRFSLPKVFALGTRAIAQDVAGLKRCGVNGAKGLLLLKGLAFALVASAMTPMPANATKMFGLDEDHNLVYFDSNSLGAFRWSKPITGTDATFLAIDTVEGDLYPEILEVSMAWQTIIACILLTLRPVPRA